MILNNGLVFLSEANQCGFGGANNQQVSGFKNYSNADDSAYIFIHMSSSPFGGFMGWQQIRSSITGNFGMTYIARSGSYLGVSNGTTYYKENNTSTSNECFYGGVIFGDGDTAPALTDYCLSGNMITDFSASTAISRAIENGKIKATITYNILNTGASPIIIKEMGVSIPNSGSSERILLSRFVLDTPVTIAPGDTGVVTYKIEIS